MAAQIFPNCVCVEGFPSGMSRYEFLSVFGGSKGHINTVEIIESDEEPRAIIQYKHANSLPLALEMKGLWLSNHPRPLNVRVVDEHFLCDYVPGEKYDAGEALANLQKVLFSVLASRDQARSAYRINMDHLTQESLAGMDELRKSLEQYKAEKQEEHRNMDSNLLQVIAQRDRTIDQCVKLKAENQALKERVREAGVFERESSSKLIRFSSQLRNTNGRCAELQKEIDALNTRLTGVDSELKVERRHSSSESKEIKDLREDLAEATMRKEGAMESLGIADNTVLRLQVELKMAQKTAEVSQCSLWRARSALEEMDKRVHALQTYVTQRQKKHHRAEEELVDMGHAKRRLIEERDTTTGTCYHAGTDDAEKFKAECQQLEARSGMETDQCRRAEESLAECHHVNTDDAEKFTAECQQLEARLEMETEQCRRAEESLAECYHANADDAEKYKAECQQLEARLEMETHQRRRAEQSLAEAKTKLDRVLVTDSLTAAFIRLDRIAREVVEETLRPDASTSR